jgi:hypothetical protein
MKLRIALGVLTVISVAGGLALLGRGPGAPASPPSKVRPTHAATPSAPPSDLEADLRLLQEGRSDAADRLRREDPFHIETAFLDRARGNGVRNQLLKVLESRGDGASRRFVLDVLQDTTEEMTVRLAALQFVALRRDEEGCDAILGIWNRDASWPPGARYHLVHAMGLNGRPAAMPVVRECAGPVNAVDIRGHAVQALGSWVSNGAVREHLKNVATTDGVPLIRVNALGALTKSNEADVDEFLRKLAGSEDEVGRAAKGFLEQRKR